MRKQTFKIHSFLFNVKLGIAIDNSGSERATPTFIVPTSNPASLGLMDATFVYNDRNSFADTKGIKWIVGRNRPYFWNLLSSSFSIRFNCHFYRNNRMTFNTYTSLRRKWFLLVMLLLVSITYENENHFVKTPIFWKNFNETHSSLRNMRRLHDYLSIIPSYGDSKKLG